MVRDRSKISSHSIYKGPKLLDILHIECELNSPMIRSGLMIGEIKGPVKFSIQTSPQTLINIETELPAPKSPDLSELKTFSL